MEPNNNMQNGMNRPRRVMTPGGVPMGGGVAAVSGAGAPRPMRAPGHANVPSEVTGGLGSDTGVPVEKPKKKSHAMLFGMIFLAILAAGGIGFGVWAMLDGNAKVAKKDERIAELNSQVSQMAEKEQAVEEEDVEVDVKVDGYKNPVIKSLNSDEIYRIGLETSRYFTGEGNNYRKLAINLKDGAVESCSVFQGSIDDDKANGGTFLSDCQITGITGEIYSVVEFGEGQDNSNSNIGFIMTDGSVEYFPFIEAMKNNDFSIKGKLGMDGIVINAIGINVGYTDPQARGGYGSTVFVMSDGSYVKFNESMTE